MHRYFTVITLVLSLLMFSSESRAQRVAVSTDLVDWCTLSPNASVELVSSQHSSLCIGASFSPWRLSESMYLRHITLTPEWRWYFSGPMSGHNTGVRVVWSSYDFAVKGRGKSGDMVGAGAVYGWTKVVGKRLNIKPTVSLGAAANFRDGLVRVAPLADVGIEIQVVLK